MCPPLKRVDYKVLIFNTRFDILCLLVRGYKLGDLREVFDGEGEEFGCPSTNLQGER